jgi:hypothetical protein
MTTTNVFEKSVAVSLEIGRIGTRKKVQKGKMVLKEGEGEQPDQNSVAASKELIDSKEFDAIVSLDNLIRNEISRLALPSHFRAGIYLVPIATVEKIDEMIRKYKEMRMELIEKFLASYKQSVIDAQNRLGGLFNINDYSSMEAIRESFQVNYSYLDLGLPKNLGTISNEIFQREQAIFNEKMVTAANEIQAGLRQAFKDLVDHMADRLKPGDDGKPKIFRDSLVKNLADFLETFKYRNITDDNELSGLVDRAKELLRGKNADVLRNSETFRDEVSKGLNDIKSSLSSMVVDAPRRKFSFDD